MIKKMLLAFLLLLALANTVSAHTGLESSIPQDGEVVTEQVQEIVLNFNTKVEQGSSFEIKSVNGVVIPITGITLNENQMKGTVQQPLENGDYLVQWDIIGADGHPIEGEFTFVAEIEQTEDVKEELNEDKEIKDNETNAPPPSSNELPETENQQDSLPLSILLIMMVIMILIIVGAFFIIFKRKNE